MDFKVVELFTSINGEGQRCGQLAIFIRFKGCNLNCSYCDTTWAKEESVDYILMSAEELYDYIKNQGIRNVTLTGGEPLMQPGIEEFINLLAKDKELVVEIETNGSIGLNKFSRTQNPPSFTMDYKLPGSGMENLMNLQNFFTLTFRDTVKFVAGSNEDLVRAKEIIYRYSLQDRVKVYISPVFGKISSEEIVDFMIQNKLNGINLQLQLHKFIWEPNRRGV
jgi:7-carboxy-7-deazaguanine synthase